MSRVFEFEARFVPVEVASRVIDPVERRPVVERFDRFTFAPAAKRPQDVAVVLEHPELSGRRREVGRLRWLGVDEEWWTGRFRLSPDARGADLALARDVLEVGRPVSAAFTPTRSRPFGRAGVEHLAAELHELAIVQPGAACYPGAGIVRRWDVSREFRAEQVERALARVEARARARVPEPLDVPPWAEKAARAGAERGILIRPGIGYVVAVR